MAYFKCNGYGRILGGMKPADIVQIYQPLSVLTWEQFLDWLTNGGAKYVIDNGLTSQWLRKQATIPNSVKTVNYQIADFNHDSTSYTIDMVATNYVGVSRFNTADAPYYSSSIVRSWLNGTFYNGYISDVKDNMVTMYVKTNEEIYWRRGYRFSELYDYVKLLSVPEVGGYMTAGSWGASVAQMGYSYDGYKYPIYTSSIADYNSIIRNDSRAVSNSGYSVIYWWLRSQADSHNAYDIAAVGASEGGSITGTLIAREVNDYSVFGVVPVIRFQAK